MIKNYFKIAFRNLLWNKFFSIINISGLAIGMASAILIYDYRVTISWETFFVAGLISVFIALLTVSYQSIKAAVANPVKSLRTE